MNATDINVTVTDMNYTVIYSNYIVANVREFKGVVDLYNLQAGYCIVIYNEESDVYHDSYAIGFFIVKKAFPFVEETITEDIKLYNENVTVYW